MSQKNEDFDQNFDMLMNFVLEKNRSINFEDILLLVENLREELKFSRENASLLQKRINSLLISEKTDLNNKFVLLREYCDKLEMENTSLNDQVSELNTQLKFELEFQKSEMKKNMDNWEKKSQQDLEKLKAEMEKERMSFRSNENNLTIQLETAYAETAIRCDEIESTLKRQLVDVSNKLRESQNVVRNQQIEIKDLKMQIKRYQETNSVSHLQESNLPQFNNNPSQSLISNRYKNVMSYKSSSHFTDNDTEGIYSNHQSTHLVGELLKSSVSKNVEERIQSAKNDQENSYDDPGEDVTERMQMYSLRLTNQQVIKEKLRDETLNSKQLNPFIQEDENITREGKFVDNQLCSRKLQVNKTSKQRPIHDQPRLKNSCSQSDVLALSSKINLEASNQKYPPLPLMPISATHIGNTVHRSQSCIQINQIGQKPSAHKSQYVEQKNLPPLIPCSNSNPMNRKSDKRRKLYNPDDYESLLEIIE